MPIRSCRPLSRNGRAQPPPKAVFSTLAAAILLWSWGGGRTMTAAPDASDGAAAAEGEDDAEPGLVARLRGHLGSGVCASFSRDGKKILTAGHHSAWLWDGATYRRLTPP